MQPSDIIYWPEAIQEGGFYFERARHFGLPPPPAAAVYDEMFLGNDSALELSAAYHAAFKEAEATVTRF